jgi:ribosome biogenesis protein UTP30
MAVLPASASSSTLIDDHVSTAQCTKAVDALLKHTTAHQDKVAENELLPGAEPLVWLVLAVKKMTPEKKLKPFKMYISYSNT